MTRPRRLSRFSASRSLAASFATVLLAGVLTLGTGCDGKNHRHADTAGNADNASPTAAKPTAPDGSALLDPLAFRALYLERLRADRPDYSVTVVSPTELKIKKGDGPDITCRLDNSYQAYTAKPEYVDDLVNAHLASVIGAAEREAGAKIDIAKVVPIIKSASYIAATKKDIAARSTDAKPEHELYAFPLNDELMILLAENSETSLRYLSQGDVDSLPLKGGELQVQSVKNLLPLIGNLKITSREGIYMMEAGGNFEASLILVTGLWTPEYLKVQGDYVMAVPSRDMVLVTGSEETQKIDVLRILARRLYAERPYSISPQLFVKREGGWELLPESADGVDLKESEIEVDDGIDAPAK